MAATRRPHRKSRLGCATCKKRRVKCDETGPPCGPCISRCIPCEYANTPRSKPTPPEEAGLHRDSHALTSTIGADWSAARRLLELELLHQWATVTYKSYCGTVVDEYYNWQVVVPRLALGHDCLLHGMLAMSALEIAAFAEDNNGLCNHYVNIALEYHNLASSGLRMELLDVTPSNRQALFALSSILMVLGLALPRFASKRGEQGNMLDYMKTYLALLNGLRLIVDTKPDFRHTEPLLSDYRTWDSLPARKLEPELHLAVQSLVTLNEEMHGASRTELSTPEIQALSYHAANRRALFYLEQEFGKCRDPDTRAYALGWPLRAGHDYMAAIAEREPVALVILMAWGVLVEQVSYDIWWMQSVGKKLVESLSEMMIDMSLNENFNEAFRWARKQVGLED